MHKKCFKEWPNREEFMLIYEKVQAIFEAQTRTMDSEEIEAWRTTAREEYDKLIDSLCGSTIDCGEIREQLHRDDEER